MTFIDTAKARLRQIRSDTSGNSIIEFAFGLPILLSVSLTGVEVSRLALAHARVSQIAHMAADNASRVRISIDETDINDTFKGINDVGNAIDFYANGRVVISQLIDNTATTGNLTDDKILWQRCKGAKATPTNLGAESDVLTAGMGLPSKPATEATVTDAIVFVEVYYEFKPVLKWAEQILGTVQKIRYSSSYNVRDRSDNGLKNGSSLTAAQKSTCNYFNTTV